MPTGYTSGILNGSLQTFADYAKLCTRAFGATIHLRDDRLDSEYTPRTPSEYHVESIKKDSAELARLDQMLDEELLRIEHLVIEEEIERSKRLMEENTIKKKRLEDFLSKAQGFVAPTAEHQGFKDFLVSQITETISWDTNDRWHQESIEQHLKRKELTAVELRAEKRSKLTESIEYHTNEHAKELKRCEEANRWYQQVIESINAV